jgi:membrane protease YdiL (CAAX protease family)
VSLNFFKLSLSDGLFLVLSAAGLGLFYVYGAPHAAIVYFAILTLGCYVAPPMQKYFFSSQVFLLAGTVSVLLNFLPYLSSWPFELFLVGLACWFVFKRKGVDFSGSWSLRWNKNQIYSGFAIVVASFGPLQVFFATHPEEAARFPFPTMPPSYVPWAIVAIGLVNGLREEFLYRFVMQKAFARDLTPFLAILLQALAFGCLHYQAGFPSGPIGVGLTVMFGLLLGFQFYFWNNFSLTWLTHAVTDIVMFVVILRGR